MLALLRSENATVFFANVVALRQAGMLTVLTGSKPVTDPEYQDFLRQTHFDYTKDLDEVAGTAGGAGIFFIVRGRFDWRRLRDYVSMHGGTCAGGICNLPTSRPGRWASYREVQPDVMGLALSSDRSAAETLQPRRKRNHSEQAPAEPVWVKVSPNLLRNPADLPEGVRLFAIALQPANSVVLSLARAADIKSNGVRSETGRRLPDRSHGRIRAQSIADSDQDVTTRADARARAAQSGRFNRSFDLWHVLRGRKAHDRDVAGSERAVECASIARIIWRSSFAPINECDESNVFAK